MGLWKYFKELRMNRLKPDFKDTYNLFNYSYEFLEPFFDNNPTYYEEDTLELKPSRKHKVPYKRPTNKFYGVKGCKDPYTGMYGRDIVPYSIKYYEESSRLHFYSIDDESMSVVLHIDKEQAYKAIFNYLALYTQLQSVDVFEKYFLNIDSVAAFNYN